MTKTDKNERHAVRITDGIFGCNPDPGPGAGGWIDRTGRIFDVFGEVYGPGNWSLGCHDGVVHNSPRVVGPGTIGWIHRSDGEWGHLAGIIGFTGTPYLGGDGGVYCDGMVFPLPFEWWVPGKDINAAGWSNRSPWGDSTPRRVRNGEELVVADVAILESLIHPVARDWVTARRQLWTP